MPDVPDVREIIALRAVRVAPPATTLIRSGIANSQLSTTLGQRFLQENRGCGGFIYSRLTNVHDSCCFYATLFRTSCGLDRPRSVSIGVYRCRLMSCFASKEPGQAPPRPVRATVVGVLYDGHCDALRLALAAGTLCLSSTSAKVMFERLFARQRGEERSCLQPKAPCPTCVRRNSPRPYESRPGPLAGGERRETDPHSSNAAAWCDTALTMWIPGPDTAVRRPHKVRRAKKHARRLFHAGKNRRACRKAGRVTGPQPAPTTVNPSAPSEVSVSHTLARPTPQFTPHPGIGLVTFPQINALLAVR